jgi:hypothetical protein
MNFLISKNIKFLVIFLFYVISNYAFYRLGKFTTESSMSYLLSKQRFLDFKEIERLNLEIKKLKSKLEH